MKDYIEERAIEIANYIIEERTTVRQAAKKFGVSKSTIHVEVTKQNDLCGKLNRKDYKGWVTVKVCYPAFNLSCHLYF